MMTFPIPIQTNQGVIHLYCKNQLPIIGTRMTKSRYAIIIVTETKIYCGFLSEKVYEIKQYNLREESNSKLCFIEATAGSRLTVTENELIKYPFERMKPFNLHEDNKTFTPSIYIDFFSFPNRTTYPIDITKKLFVWKINEWEPLPLTDLTIKIQLKVYEYDNYNQATDIINSNTFENDPKLEMMLQTLWKIEQGIEILPLKKFRNENISCDEPPNYENEKDLHTQSALKEFTDEFIESQKSNKLLIEEVEILKITNEELKRSNTILLEKVKTIETEIFSVKSLFSRLYGNSMNDRFEVLKARIECGYDVNNDPGLDEIVKNILLSPKILHKSIDDVDLLKLDDLNYMRELIKYGYSVTNPTIDNSNNCGHYMLQMYSQCKISPLVCYIAFSVGGSELPSEKHLLLFKTILELVIPNANLKRKYDKIGTIIEWLTKQSSDIITFAANFTSQTNEAIKKNIRTHIKFLTNMGFE
jgi:hypothetical protein